MNEYQMFSSKEEYNEWFIKNKLFNRISEFFEQEQNWKAMKKCWLECGKSDDFRALLKKSMGLDGGNK